ncbi:MAG: sigma-54 dependent transcriptional regulator [Proteobacteria bacterium]|nr:sigma-54 dependent transcriptional regulator [Pseudomonadota bacterium]MBU1687811.1 sigma-54 dependent transcriptional regulator [Pseudomonadota bacterium]
MAKVLIIEDSDDMRLVLAGVVKKEGYGAITAATGAEGIQILSGQVIDLVFLDIGLPDVNGIELISTIHSIAPDVEVVMLTAMNDARTALNSLKSGAVDYILKPFDLDEFRHILNRLISSRMSARQISLASREHHGANLIGNSPGMVKLKEDIHTAASVRSSVLITGETGTGKELVARAIHQSVSEKSSIFVKVDCGTLSPTIIESELFGHEKGAFTDARGSKKGLVEMADGGILFLDEIGNLPLTLQPKLLRLIEESTFRRVGGVKDIQVNVRVVAATNADVAAEVRDGRFRDDLYYRLNVIHLKIPPLRNRGRDVLLLADHYLHLFAKEIKKEIKGFTPEAEEAFQEYDWPGNVRELKNFIERGVIYCHGDRISSVGLQMPLKQNPMAPETAMISMAEMEKRHISQVLAASGQNKSLTARILKISRTTLREKMAKWSESGQVGGS